MKTLAVKEIPVPKKFKHPPPPSNELPKHEFTMGLIAPKGSGKTTLICNLLEFYKGYFHSIFVFSPTVASDEKWDYVKRLPLLSENVALKAWIKKVAEARKKKNTVVEERPIDVPLKYTPPFSPEIPEENFKSEYDPNDLKEIMDKQMELVELLKSHGESKHLANRILIIFDDLVGSSLFSSTRDNPFKRFNTNHRHYSCSAIMVTQAYKEIPKTVRTQFSCGILFSIPNEKELEVIYEENPMNLSRTVWQQAYDLCTEGEFNFMFFNYQKPKGERIMKNFEQYIVMGK